MLNLIDVHTKFHDEHIAFSVATRYLYGADVVAWQGIEPLAGSHADLAERIEERYGSPRQYFLSRLFIGHVSAFELFLKEAVMAVVARHPHKVGSVQFRLADVLETPDTEELVQRAVEEHLNKIMYKKPLEYLGELTKLFSFPETLVSDIWPVFVEAKARRDLGVHNDWICNQTYIRKLAEAKVSLMVKLGERLLPTDGTYLSDVSDCLYEIAGRLYKSCSAWA